MTQKKVYSAYFSATILAGATGNVNFSIPLNQLETKVRSLTWDWFGRTLGASNIISKFNNQNQELYMQFYAVNTLPLASFINVAAPTPAGMNGAGFRFYNPGTYQFDDFYAQNDLGFNFTQINHDLLLAVQYYLTFVLEIEIL